jgi:2-oxoglutarate dehydrogenase complex dehydrogenase (E1) component-like enzyme
MMGLMLVFKLMFLIFYLILLFLFLQIHREFRKPLIVMSPKNLLRSKACRSNLSEFDDVKGHPGFDKQGTRFKRLIKDRNAHSNVEEGIRRLVLCSGKVCGFYNYVLYI